jgi:soluble lytic murein transglycosylase-like protein
LAHATVAMLLLALQGHAEAQVYAGGSDGDGPVVLSNFQSPQAPQLLIPGPEVAPPSAAPVPPAVPVRAAARRAKPSTELQGLIDSIAAKVQIAPELLHAVIAVESNYELKALSPRGAMGLMQLLPATAKRFGANDAYSAADNVLAGASYLKWLMGVFGDNLELVLAAYNSGEQAVIKAGRKIPPYPETQAYVPRVLAALQDAAKAPR